METLNIQPTVDYQNVTNKDAFYITCNVPGTSAQTSGNYGRFIVFRNPVQILRITEIHEVAATVGTVTLDVLAVPNATAIAGGTSLLVAQFNLKSTADTLVIKQTTDLTSARLVPPNYALALKVTGTLTTLAGVQVTVYFQNTGRGSYK